MTISSIERGARAGLPIARFMQAYLPLPVAHWLIKLGMVYVRLDFDMTHEAISADGVRCERVIPQNSPKSKVLPYLHGVVSFLD